MTATPTLLGVAHGTRDPAGAADTAALLDAVRLLRPGLRVEVAYVELAEPSVEEALVSVAGPVVVVPLLLSTGYHVKVDLPRMVAAAGERVRLAPALGPHPLLAEALHARLGEVGWRSGEAVVLGAAGSSDPAGVADVEAMAGLLSARLGAPVSTGFASAARPSVAEAVAAARGSPTSATGTPATGTPAPRVAVASYLLAAGYFADVVACAGADLTSTPLRDHPAVARLVLERYDAAAASLA